MNAAPELLKAAVQGDEQACEQMLRENSGLIWSIEIGRASCRERV